MIIRSGLLALAVVAGVSAWRDHRRSQRVAYGVGPRVKSLPGLRRNIEADEAPAPEPNAAPGTKPEKTLSLAEMIGKLGTENYVTIHGLLMRLRFINQNAAGTNVAVYNDWAADFVVIWLALNDERRQAFAGSLTDEEARVLAWAELAAKYPLPKPPDYSRWPLVRPDYGKEGCMIAYWAREPPNY